MNTWVLINHYLHPINHYITQFKILTIKSHSTTFWLYHKCNACMFMLVSYPHMFTHVLHKLTIAFLFFLFLFIYLCPFLRFSTPFNLRSHTFALIYYSHMNGHIWDSLSLSVPDRGVQTPHTYIPYIDSICIFFIILTIYQNVYVQLFHHTSPFSQ